MVTVWRYHLPNQKMEGWAIAFLDAIGCFTVVSDYGSYGHRWPQDGWGPGDFRSFFVQAEDEYLLRKLARRETYDGDRTRANVRARICELRRGKNWSRDRAAEEWQYVKTFDDLRLREDFARWYDRTSLDEAYELAVYDFANEAQGFATHVLPRLKAAIRAELAAEATRSGLANPTAVV